MKIFLAGAGGAIGRPLGSRLVSAGHDVAGTTRRPERADELRSLGVRPVLVDVFDADELAAALKREAPDVVVHQLTDLANADSAANAHMRVTGTRNLVDAARSAGVEAMLAQSISWVYAPGSAAAVESDPLDFEAAPPRAKTVSGVVALEDAVGEMERGVVLRYGTLYGPRTWYAADGSVAQQVRDGALRASGDLTCFVHVEDAVSAAVQALDWPAGPVNVVDDEPARRLDWVPAFAAAVGAPRPLLDEQGAGGARAVSNELARSRGWAPRFASWRQGFAEAI